MKLTATKEVYTKKDIDNTKEDLGLCKCDYSIGTFGNAVIFTIHDHSDFVMSQVNFNDFLLSSARN